MKSSSKSLDFKLFWRYLTVFSYMLAILLLIFRWKRNTILQNIQLCGNNVDRFSVWTLYKHASMDFLCLLHHCPIPGLSIPFPSTPLWNRFRNEGGILLTAHFHHWEAMGSWLYKNEVPLLAYAQDLQNPLAQFGMQKLRSWWGIPTISFSQIRTSLRHLRSKGCLALLLDQHAPKSALSSLFFGNPVQSSQLLSFLRKGSNPSIYFMVPIPKKGFRLVRLCPQDSSISTERLIRRYFRCLEILIKRYPTFWYGWFHRYFKTVKPYPY